MATGKIYICMISMTFSPFIAAAAQPLKKISQTDNIEVSSLFDGERYGNHRFESERFASPAFVIPLPAARPKSVDQPCIAVDPVAVSKMVRTIAKEEGFDEDLAEAVAWAESSLGENQGPSSAGALGIMQLMAGTADDLGVSDRCDAEQNIRGGIQYLKQLHSKFNDPLLMLAAYNAGAGNVYKANGIPANTETSKYIVKILNRWKLSKVVNGPSSMPEALPTSSPVPTKPSTEKAAWKDGHVFDFGE